jgi:hypothetical protein
MSCLEPGRAVEAACFILPVRPDEVALAIEDVVPRLLNATKGVGDCRAVAAITDRFESCVFEQSHIPCLPEAAGPIVPLAGDSASDAVLDSWLAKGTLLGEDGQCSVFVAFLEVMRRPFQGSWTVQTLTILGTKQSVASLLDEIEREESWADAETPAQVLAI